MPIDPNKFASQPKYVEARGGLYDGTDAGWAALVIHHVVIVWVLVAG